MFDVLDSNKVLKMQLDKQDDYARGYGAAIERCRIDFDIHLKELNKKYKDHCHEIKQRWDSRLIDIKVRRIGNDDYPDKPEEFETIVLKEYAMISRLLPLNEIVYVPKFKQQGV